jgi:AAA15 family ATPase/GTPase
MTTLLALKVKNFRSFYSEQTLDLGGKTSHEVTALFGPNSGGKSNTAKALITAVTYIVNSANANFRPPYDPFLLRDTSAQEPSCFELFFEQGNRYYNYSFAFMCSHVTHE